MTAAPYVFQFARAYRATAVMVARGAVLTPLTHPVRDDAELRHAVLTAIYRWRHAANELLKHGWQPWRRGQHEVAEEVQGWRVGRILNCRPPFIEVSPRSEYCTHVAVCPFCYARRIANTYTLMLERLRLHESEHAPEGRTRPVTLDATDTTATARYWLLERRHDFNRPLGETPAYREAADMRVPLTGEEHLPREYPLRDPLEIRDLGQTLQANFVDLIATRRKILDVVRPDGALLYLSGEPWEGCWHFEHRQLYIVPRGYTVPAELVDKTRGVLTLHENVTAKTVASAIRRTFAYPSRLLLGDHSLLAIYLNARRRHRMWATTGMMRVSQFGA